MHAEILNINVKTLNMVPSSLNPLLYPGIGSRLLVDKQYGKWMDRRMDGSLLYISVL